MHNRFDVIMLLQGTLRDKHVRHIAIFSLVREPVDKEKD